MRINNNHVFTGGTEGPKGPNDLKMKETFQKNGPIDTSSRPLAGRCTEAKSVTARGKELTEEVRNIIKNIPTPFLKHS